MSINIDVTGVLATEKFLGKKNKRLLTLQKAGIAKAGIHIQNEVKQSIAGRKAEKQSVDTGRFLNSVGLKTFVDNAIIDSLVSYGKFLEFGTSKFPARRHFKNTANREKGRVIDIIRKEIKKV